MRPLLALALACLVGFAGTQAAAEAPTKKPEKVDKLTPLAEFIQNEGVFQAGSGIAIFFEQEPTSGEYNGDVDIGGSRMHIDNGQPLWNARQSMPISTSVYVESNVTAIGDGAGGWFTAYQAAAKTGTHAGASEIFAQRIGPGGKPMWHEGQKSLVAASTEWQEEHPILVSDGQGGAILVYTMRTNIGEHAGDSDIAAQRLTASGELLWGDGNGLPVPNSKPREENPQVLPMSDGGVLVVFQATPRSGERAGIGGIFAQKLSNTGERIWNKGEHPSVVSLSTWSEESPIAVADGEGGAFVVFQQRGLEGDHAGDLDLAAQRITADGEPAWNKGERPVAVAESIFLERSPVVVSDGAGGIIVVYEAEPRSGARAGNVDIWAQRISAKGERTWNNGQPLFVATSKWSETNPQAISDEKGGVFIAFEQHAPRGDHAGDVDIAAQHLLADGSLGWHGGGSAIDMASSDRLEEHPRLVSDGNGGAILVYEAVERKGQYAGDRDLFAQRFSPDGKPIWNDGKQPSPVASSRLQERNATVVRH